MNFHKLFMENPMQTQSLGIRRVVAFAALLFTASPALGADESKSSLPVALGGHCPVSYQSQSKAVKGDPAHAAVHQGRVYHCASADAKKTFEAQPEKYAAQFGEFCSTALGGMYGNRLPSDPTVFYVIDGKLYLFSSLRARNAFDKSPPDYIAKAEKLFATPALSGYDATAYQFNKKAEKGDARHTRVHRAMVLHFLSGENAAKFDKDPERFIPKYDGYCAEGVANGHRFQPDPKVFSVVDERTYFFFDEKAKAKFDANPTELIQKADADWKASPGVKKGPVTQPQP
jgi:YHS domain-containing protein